LKINNVVVLILFVLFVLLIGRINAKIGMTLAIIILLGSMISFLVVFDKSNKKIVIGG